VESMHPVVTWTYGGSWAHAGVRRSNSQGRERGRVEWIAPWRGYAALSMSIGRSTVIQLTTGAEAAPAAALSGLAGKTLGTGAPALFE